MADRDDQIRAMVGDMVLTIATLKAENDTLRHELLKAAQELADVKAAAAKPDTVRPMPDRSSRE